MNPGHEALAILREFDQLARTLQERHPLSFQAALLANPKLAQLRDRARGILFASGGMDGCGIRQPAAGGDAKVGWCSSCAAWHRMGEPGQGGL